MTTRALIDYFRAWNTEATRLETAAHPHSLGGPAVPPLSLIPYDRFDYRAVQLGDEDDDKHLLPWYFEANGYQHGAPTPPSAEGTGAAAAAAGAPSVAELPGRRLFPTRLRLGYREVEAGADKWPLYIVGEQVYIPNGLMAPDVKFPRRSLHVRHSKDSPELSKFWFPLRQAIHCKFLNSWHLMGGPRAESFAEMMEKAKATRFPVAPPPVEVVDPVFSVPVAALQTAGGAVGQAAGRVNRVFCLTYAGENPQVSLEDAPTTYFIPGPDAPASVRALCSRTLSTGGTYAIPPEVLTDHHPTVILTPIYRVAGINFWDRKIKTAVSIVGGFVHAVRPRSIPLPLPVPGGGGGGGGPSLHQYGLADPDPTSSSSSKTSA